MSKEIFIEEEKQRIKKILSQLWVGEDREVEDVAKEIYKTMFPLTKQQITEVDAVVASLIYDGGIQEEMDLAQRLELGLCYITEKLQ